MSHGDRAAGDVGAAYIARSVAAWCPGLGRAAWSPEYHRRGGALHPECTAVDAGAQGRGHERRQLPHP